MHKIEISIFLRSLFENYNIEDNPGINTYSKAIFCKQIQRTLNLTAHKMNFSFFYIF